MNLSNNLMAAKNSIGVIRYFSLVLSLFFLILPFTPRIGDFRADYLLLPIVYLGLFILSFSRMKIDRNSCFILGIFIVYPLIMTLFSKVFFGNSFVLKDFYYYFGAVRFFAIYLSVSMLLKLGVWDNAKVHRIILYVSLSICFIGMLELFYNDLSVFLVKTFSNPQDTIQVEHQLANVIGRAISTVGHPSTLGFFCLILISSVISSKKTHVTKKVLFLCIALLAGIATYSKVFLLGSIILLLYRILLIDRRYLISKLVIISLVIWITLLFVEFDAKFTYLTNVIFVDGVEGILATRFGDGGNLHEPISILSDTLFLGIGSDSTLGIFKGDSLFLTITLLSGIPGLLVFMYYWIRMCFQMYRKAIINKGVLNERQGILQALDYLVIMFSVGVGFNPLFGDRLLEISAVILANGAYMLNKNRE